jgi:hypothetical protein
MKTTHIETPAKILDSKGLQRYDFSGREFNLYDYKEFNDNTETPFFLFIADGKVIAAAHLQYSDLDGESGAANRFFTKHGVTNEQKIFCFDPLLKWR